MPEGITITGDIKLGDIHWAERKMNTLRKDSSEATDTLAEHGQRLYDQLLRPQLEPGYNDEFVAIELESEHYLLGSTGLAELHADREALPKKLFYLLRVGSDATYRMGGYGTRRR